MTDNEITTFSKVVLWTWMGMLVLSSTAVHIHVTSLDLWVGFVALYAVFHGIIGGAVVYLGLVVAVMVNEQWAEFTDGYDQ